MYFIVSAGNYGPMPGTMNPFSKFDKSIVVGGAKNDGSDLCSFSSRGIPGIEFSGPTIVCPCENLIGKTHSGLTPIIEEQESLKIYMTRDKYEQQVRRPVSDEEWNHVKEKYVVGTGTSQATEYLVNIVFCIIYFRNQRGFISDLRVIRSILLDMAQPIKDYKNFEIGGGFVNFKIADDYLIRIEKGEIPKHQKEIWSRKYYLPAAKNGKTHITWSDNTYELNQVSFVDENERTSGDFNSI